MAFIENILNSGVGKVAQSAMSGNGSIAQNLVGAGMEATGVSSYIGIVGSTMSALGLGSTFSGTIGAVLANGLTLSCWGASLTPQMANDNLAKHYVPTFTYLLDKLRNASTVAQQNEWGNYFIMFTYKAYDYYTNHKAKQANWSSCALKAINDVYKPFMKKMKESCDSLISDLVSKGAVKTMASGNNWYSFRPEWYGETDLSKWYDGPGDKAITEYPVLDFSKVKSSVVQNSTPVAVYSGVNPIKLSTSVNAITKANATKVNVTNPSDKDLSFPWWLLSLLFI